MEIFTLREIQMCYFLISQYERQPYPAVTLTSRRSPSAAENEPKGVVNLLGNT